MAKREPTDVEVRDRGSEIFQEDVFNDELLDALYRGHLPPHIFLDRVVSLLYIAKARAYRACVEDIESAEAANEADMHDEYRGA